jgi:pimeloyl-ACP methyl ester carboxylesterase
VRYRFGRYQLDLASRDLSVDGRRVSLQPQPFDVLAYLVAHRERVVPKEELLRALWPDSAVTDASLQRAVSLARRALRREDRGLVRTHARRGYRFVGTVDDAEPGPDAGLDAAPRWVRSGEVHVAYRTVGERPPDVVLVLGWSLSMKSALELPGVRSLVRAIAARGRAILFDKRGTGASDRVKTLPSLAQRSDDLEAVLDAAGSPGAVVVGVSEGGPLAIHVAATRPRRVKGLVLVGAFARMAAAPGHPHGWSEDALARLRGYVRSSWGTGATLGAIVPERHRTPALLEWAARSEQEGASPGAALDLVEMNSAIDVRDLLPRIRVPTVVLHAAADPVIHPGNGRELASAIPGARLVEAPGDDHAFLFAGRPRLEEELAALLDRAGASVRG